MKKIILAISLLALVVLSGCWGKEEVAPVDEDTVPAEESREESTGNIGEPPMGDETVSESEESSNRYETFLSGDIYLEYPGDYTIEVAEEGFTRVTVQREEGRIEIFRESDAEGSPLMSETPQDRDHIGRQVYGYDVWMFYPDSAMREELQTIVDTIQIVTSYPNKAHSFTVTFPQDWYFNFEENDMNCLSPYEKGAIATSEDCSEALIRIYVEADFDHAKSKAEAIPGQMNGKSTEESQATLGDHEAYIVWYEADDLPNGGIAYAINFADRFGLVFDLNDAGYFKITEDIISWLE